MQRPGRRTFQTTEPRSQRPKRAARGGCALGRSGPSIPSPEMAVGASASAPDPEARALELNPRAVEIQT
ncbi:hypothetical protein PRBEI_2001177000 [Prionailurus iriomotensis]